MRMMDEIRAGAVGGLAGGGVMTVAMLAGKKTGMIDEPMPLKVERRLEEKADVHTGPRRQRALSMAEHMGISAGYGALYGAAHSMLRLPPLIAGPLYGLGVWAINFAGVGRSIGVTPPPQEEQRKSLARELVMHAVYGTVTATVLDRLRQDRD